MAKQIGVIQGAVGGISDTPKSGTPGSVAFARALDIRTNPSQLSVNPKTIRQAGSLIKDLPMWGELALTQVYFYGNTGTIYEKDSSNNWSIGHTTPASSGNGLAYFAEDGYLYYMQDKTIGRRSNATSTTGTYYDGYLESEGGEPTNVYSLNLASASSQYAYHADVASLSITNDLSIETYLKFTSLPSAGSIQTIMSKWLENGNQRSYKFDVTTSNNFFGSGADGALTISADTTQAPIDSACSGTSGTYSLSATNVSFAANQAILIIQMQGTNAGLSQRTTIQSYTAGTITTADALQFTTSSTGSNKAQVIVLPQYTNVTVNTGKTWTAKAWNGATGGILAFIASGTFTNNGTVLGDFKGFRGGAGNFGSGATNFSGEGSSGAGVNQLGNGYVGSVTGSGGGTVDIGHEADGAGGGNATTGGLPVGGLSDTPQGGLAVGSADLTSINLGGGGGGGRSGFNLASGSSCTGGNGGGIGIFFTTTFTNNGTISFNGDIGLSGRDTNGNWRTGGSGAGGSILIKAQTATLGTITATGGASVAKSYPGLGTTTNSGAGSTGRIALYYSSSFTGTTTPTVNSILDSTLSNVSGYALRLLISSNGTNSEIYQQDITNIIQTGVWMRLAVTWTASTSTVIFYQNANPIGTKTGTFTAIYDSTANFAIGTSYDGTSTAVNFLNAKIDDVRIWNAVRTQALLQYYTDRVLTGVETNLVGYWKFENNYNDSQTYSTVNNLTSSGSPTFVQDVPFSGVTTRADQDVLINASGQTYTLGTVLSEAATDRQTFQPTKEPLKSIELNINTVGTGNWTVVIHDAQNRAIETLTVANAQLHTGIYEFIFSSVSRPILTANYHVHVYSTVGDGKIVTSSLNDMEGTTGDTGAYLGTFFQILVSDIYHPAKQFLNFVAIGNERYVAKLEAGNVYNPHQLTLPAGYRVRSLAYWNEYLAIGVWKGNTITDTDQGKVFLWDGSSDTANVSVANSIIDVLEGGVNAMEGVAGKLYAVCGYKGKLVEFAGYYSGGQTQKLTQVPPIKDLQPGEYSEIAPGAMCTWQTVLRIGATLNTNSNTVHQGIYGYGKLNFNYPNALGLDFPLSLGDQTSNHVKIGCVFPKGDTLYIGWQNGNTFGIDSTNIANDPYDTATVELLIADLQKLATVKYPLVYRLDHSALVAGQSLQPKFKADREDNWHLLDIQTTLGAQETRAIISAGVKEVQVACDIVTNGSQLTIFQNALEVEVPQARGI